MTIFDQRVLVVNQKAKIIEITNEYAILDENGTQIGAVRQIGQNAVRKVLRAVSSIDQFLTTKLEVVDTDGSVVLQLTRPAKIFKSKVLVADGAGKEIGSILQENMIGKIRFSLQARGQTLGSINAENWRAWDFNVQDTSGREVARIKKKFEGMVKFAFTTADNYIVNIPQPLEDPLRSLVVAAALSVDTALKQDSRGLS